MTASVAAAHAPRDRLWLRGVVPAWCAVLGALTLAIVGLPQLSFAFSDPPRAAALETFMVLVATMAAFVGLARFAIERRSFDLAIAVARPVARPDQRADLRGSGRRRADS